MRRKRKNSLLITLITISSVIVLLTAGFFIYASVYYHADNVALQNFAELHPSVKTESGKNYLAFKGDEIKGGVILYPGAKVEYTSYSALATALADNGYLCVLLKVPFNLAFFSSNAADRIPELYPEVSDWYLGGHSLGGAIAAKCLAKSDKYQGLILLAAYSADDLTAKNAKVLSVYGSNDKSLNQKSYLKYKKNLPADFTEKIIDGGCHSYFGTYGIQKRDGTPSIDNFKQIEVTASLIDEFITNK